LPTGKENEEGLNVKRWIALLLALALTFGLTACSSKEASW